ncbi:hypothetical protein FLO80_09635 [Aquicoccus porphyridii]|uniref:Nuclear transport factor 2 family protein n=1 Tax=Aquicoccus porphyridii TaxID=1852029 RepID=A0A5A9ZH39_9RHOB|nr:hypothetical protein [Aquicoccus porphyridii]KAA0916359.1 hypothetical protein FLO80_09635 [Aquicoccus porphyridii]RAI53516.1 hypothetical protein DOO74_11885 [Rhodobacteraceae bacterium AsT-22]
MTTGLLVAGGLAVLAVVVTFAHPKATGDQGFAALEFGELSAEEFSNTSYEILPEMLAVIYRAFSETEEEQIYDSLAQVSADEALETLYLERMGAMVGGGLDEGNQELHAMELEGLASHRTGTTFKMNATWRVVGTVGHATHLHVRGNTYAADLTVEPVGGKWRMTSFDLTDVDRSDAGTMVVAE